MLNEFESLEQHSQKCSECEEEAVVAWSAEDNPRLGRWYPLCFGCAFVSALAKDEQAQSMALGWAMAEGLRNRNDVRVKSGSGGGGAAPPNVVVIEGDKGR